MKRHAAYFKYIVRHKLFVFWAAWKISKSPVNLWLAIIHDWSKFRPSEWFPYAATFYNPDGSKKYDPTDSFLFAWNAHQKRNKHHYQYWMLTMDRGETIMLPMPKRYMLEMLADWMGAGRAINGKWDVKNWYYKNKGNIHLNTETRRTIEWIFDACNLEDSDESHP